MAVKVRKINVTVKSLDSGALKADVIALSLFKDTKVLPKAYRAMDNLSGGMLSQLIQTGDFKADANKVQVLYPVGMKGVSRIILVGLGAMAEVTADTYRQAAGAAIRGALELSAGTVVLDLCRISSAKSDLESCGCAIAQGAVSGGYDYEDYLPAARRGKVTSLKVTIAVSDAVEARQFSKGARVGASMAEGQTLARVLANTPGNEINPPLLAARARKIASQSGLKCTIYNDKQLTQMGMNAILAVGQGSINKPRLIRLEYRGAKHAGVDVAIIGKAITFDSGGISIKPSQDMDTMKYDKSGGCAVIGIMAAAAQLKLPLNLVGLIPSAENMPGGGSYRPGDIIRSYSGKTIEVLNTDAEGRLIMSDALAFGAAMKPKAILDIATLTGAVVVALGAHHAGLFGNDDRLIGKIKAASERAGEPMWPMPSGAAYLEQMTSKMADLINTGGRSGGCCTAAAFLKEFVGKSSWAHIDIAGVADTTEAKPWRGRGATGYAVRTVLEYLRSGL